MNEPFFVIRAGRPTDHALVLETWTYHHSLTANGRDHGINYPTDQKALIRRILSRSSSELRVACDPEDPDAIYGYACVGKVQDLIPVIYYVYTKKDSQHLGVARALLADLVARQCFYSHRPPHHVAEILPAKPQNWIYNYFANFED